jgi:phosphatidylserine/phosphatidylglycerophosphate/cardiolipin synthase-like enzyme
MRAPDRVVTAVDDRKSVIVDVIRNARETIVLSLFRCNDTDIFDELARATKRGVKVEALMTSRAKGGKKKLRKLWDALEAAGVSVQPYTEPVVKYHAKYLVADDGPALVTSLNFTRKCFAKTCDAIVVTDRRHSGAADVDCRRLRGRPCPTAFRAPGIGPERARLQFTELFQQAKSSIG